MCLTAFGTANARNNPGWGNAALSCDSPRIGNDSPDLGFRGATNSFETGYYNIGRLPDSKNRFLGVAVDGKVRLLPSEEQSPVSWLVTGVGSNLYQISTCYNGQPQCLNLSDNKTMELGECAYEAYGTNAWWDVGIVLGPGKGGSELGSDSVGHMECLTEDPDTGIPFLAPCNTSGNPETTWRFEPDNTPYTETPMPEKVKSISDTTFVDMAKVITYQCESGQIVKALYDTEGDQVQVNYKDEFLTLEPIISGSGAKFGGKNKPWGWWTKAEQGTIFAYDKEGNEADIIEQCRELENVSDSTQALEQKTELTLEASNRMWSANGIHEEIILTDCRDCGEDIGMMISCQGSSKPALVSINWAAAENIPPDTTVNIEIDGQLFTYASFTTYSGMLGQVPQFNLQANDPLIDAFKKGRVANIIYGDVKTQIGLQGSSIAFDIFDAHCGWSQRVENTTQVSPMKESTVPVSDSPVSEESVSAIWHISTYFDDHTKTTVSDLIFGTPETDARALIARCEESSATVDVAFLVDITNLKSGAPYYVRLQTADFDKTYKAQVFFDNSEYSGVKLSLPINEPLWEALKAGDTFYIVPQIGNDIALKHSESVEAIQQWLNYCKK